MDWRWDQIEAIILARVSDDRDGQSDSTNQQVEEAIEECEDRGATVLEILVEDDIGASRYSRKARPNFDRALRLLREKSTKRRMLITWESSRSTRQLKRHLELREALEEAGALWMYGGRVYDMRDADDRKRTAQDAIEDEYEVEKTRKRVMRDLRKVAASGRPHGKLAYGYRLVRDERTGRSIGREIFDEQADVVREIARRILDGDSVRSVALDLNARGIPAPRPARTKVAEGEMPTPAPWRSNTLAKLIQSPTYAALRVTHGKVTGPATWPAILTMDQHERLKALLNQPGRLTHRGVEPVHLLTGIARCGHCKSQMIRSKTRGGRPAYTCSGKFCTAVDLVKLDRLIGLAIVDRLESPDVVELMSAGADDSAQAWEEARTLRARLDEFVDQAAEGELSAAALARVEAKLLPKIADAERRARAAFRSPLVARLAGPHAATEWNAMVKAEQRDVVRALVEVYVFRGGVGMRVLNPRRIFLRWAGSDEPIPDGPPPATPMDSGGDPMDFTVAEVLAYLRTVDDDEEYRRILLAERDGQARGKVMRLARAARLDDPS